MTVKQLIAKLKKMPQGLPIYIADHDHGQYETNSIVGTCEIVDKEDMDESEKERTTEKFYEAFNGTPNKYVVIRP